MLNCPHRSAGTVIQFSHCGAGSTDRIIHAVNLLRRSVDTVIQFRNPGVDPTDQGVRTQISSARMFPSLAIRNRHVLGLYACMSCISVYTLGIEDK